MIRIEKLATYVRSAKPALQALRERFEFSQHVWEKYRLIVYLAQNHRIMLKPDSMLYLWSIINVLLFLLGIVIAIKFLIVLFKADKAIDEVRDYIKRRS